MRQCVCILAMLAAFALLSSHASASEPIALCLKDMETHKMYHAVAANASGLDLNLASHSSAYNTAKNYVVVSWDSSRFSIILMQPPISVPNYVPGTGIDQDGHAWEVSLYSTNTCP